MVLPELRARSAFSFLEGASLPEALIAQAAELGIPAVALLDRDALSGAVRFHKEAKKRGIRAWIGQRSRRSKASAIRCWRPRGRGIRTCAG
jgi:DNA polymerase III alpha subunit